jgi:hypothetical protein
MRRQTSKDDRSVQFQTNLTADCDVQWLTINPPPAVEKKP